MSQNLFHYCAKFVVFDPTFTQILLCKRKWEADFNEIFSFPWGKIENSDGDIRKGMQREKNEELWDKCFIRLYKDFCRFAYYVKNDGNHMILPHHICVFEGGEIQINEEYSGYKRIEIDQLDESWLNIIPTVVPIIQSLLPYTQEAILNMSENYLL